MRYNETAAFAMPYLLALWILLTPIGAYAQSIPKDPLGFPLRQYGLILGFALLGGVVSWAGKIKRGEVKNTSITAFVGEMTTAAFTGLCAWYVGEYFNLSSVLMPPLAGLAGHMGGKLIVVGEGVVRRWAEGRALIRDTAPAPLSKD